MKENEKKHYKEQVGDNESMDSNLIRKQIQSELLNTENLTPVTEKLYTYLHFIPPDRRPWNHVVSLHASSLPNMPAERSGYLLKRSGVVGGTWSRFYFVLQRPFLYCFKSHKKAKSLSKFVDLLFITDCTICRGSEDYDIQIKSSQINSHGSSTIKWFLQAANDEDYLQWLFALDPLHFQDILASSRMDL